MFYIGRKLLLNFQYLSCAVSGTADISVIYRYTLLFVAKSFTTHLITFTIFDDFVVEKKR